MFSQHHVVTDVVVVVNHVHEDSVLTEEDCERKWMEMAFFSCFKCFKPAEQDDIQDLVITFKTFRLN